MVRDYTMEYSVEAGIVSVDGTYIDESTVKYLLDFKKYIEDRDASVYFIAPPVLEDSIVCNYDEFDKLKALEEKIIGIPYISNPTDYIFPAELMSNAVYHCNSTGEKVRTELLISDLRRAGIID